MNPLAITMFSQRKLNTYSVESPCERLPRVGSFLANPGLPKGQHLQRCMVATFVMIHESIGTLVKNKHHYALKTFAMPNTFIGKPFLYLRH